MNGGVGEYLLEYLHEYSFSVTLTLSNIFGVGAGAQNDGSSRCGQQ